MKESTAQYLNKSLLIFMVGFVFLNPIPHTTTTKEILFYLSLIILFILASTRKINLTYKTPLTIPFLLFGLWSFTGLFFALDKPSSIHDFYAHYIKYVIFYFILINVFNTPKRFKLLVWAIILSAVSFASWALIKYYWVMGKPLYFRLGSFGGLPEFITNKSELITILALLFSLNLILGKTSSSQKSILVLGLIPLFAASVLPQSVSSILCLITALIIFFLNKPKSLLTLAIIFTILLSIIHIPNRVLTKVQTGDPERVFIYLYSLEIIKNYPILGTGFGLNSFKYIKQSLPAKYSEYEKLPSTKHIFGDNKFFPKNSYAHFNGPHNMVLSTAIRTGIIGVLLMGFIVFRNFKTLWRLLWQEKNKYMKEWSITLIACFIMFLTKGTFEEIFTHFGDIIFYSMLGMATILERLSILDKYHPTTEECHS